MKDRFNHMLSWLLARKDPAWRRNRDQRLSGQEYVIREAIRGIIISLDEEYTPTNELEEWEMRTAERLLSAKDWTDVQDALFQAELAAGTFPPDRAGKVDTEDVKALGHFFRLTPEQVKLAQRIANGGPIPGRLRNDPLAVRLYTVVYKLALTAMDGEKLREENDSLRPDADRGRSQRVGGERSHVLKHGTRQEKADRWKAYAEAVHSHGLKHPKYPFYYKNNENCACSYAADNAVNSDTGKEYDSCTSSTVRKILRERFSPSIKASNYRGIDPARYEYVDDERSTVVWADSRSPG